jgi:hypothetical protein
MYDSSTQVVFENLASQIKEMLTCKSIDLNSFKSEASIKKRQEFLECDEDCLVNERSKSLAQALQIDETTGVASLMPSKTRPIYTEFLKEFAREDPKFVVTTEKRLEQLIADCKLVSGKKMLNMPVMKVNERRFIHELCGYYNIDTQSFDPEPNRNVCLYAARDKSTLPGVLLSQSLDLFGAKAAAASSLSRVLNLRQINLQTSQAPIKSQMSNLRTLEPTEGFLKLSSAYAVLAEDAPWSSGSGGAKTSGSGNAAAGEKVIDYFDMTE